MADQYRQCRIIRPNKEGIGISYQVAYIPLKYAYVGSKIKIKDLEGVWEVTEVYSMIDIPVYAEAAIRKHRERTGDSLPKKDK